MLGTNSMEDAEVLKEAFAAETEFNRKNAER